jgi:hypothetical protein
VLPVAASAGFEPCDWPADTLTTDATSRMPATAAASARSCPSRRAIERRRGRVSSVATAASRARCVRWKGRSWEAAAAAWTRRPMWAPKGGRQRRYAQVRETLRRTGGRVASAWPVIGSGAAGWLRKAQVLEARRRWGQCSRPRTRLTPTDAFSNTVSWRRTVGARMGGALRGGWGLGDRPRSRFRAGVLSARPRPAFAGLRHQLKPYHARCSRGKPPFNSAQRPDRHRPLDRACNERAMEALRTSGPSPANARAAAC